MIRVGITGSEGFIGSHLTGFLKEKPDIDIECFDNDRFDLSRTDTLGDFVRDKNCIIHLASVITGAQQEMWINEYGTYNLVKAIEKTGGRGTTFIFSSTVQVYGYSAVRRVKGESARVNPPNFHACTKILCERLLLLFKNIIDPVILRLTNVYGSGCRPYYNSVVATFVEELYRGNAVTLNNGGLQERDFLYVKDACEIIYRFITGRKGSHHVYNVATGRQVTIKRIVELIVSCLGREALINYRSINEPINRAVVSNRLLLEEVGPFTFTDLEAGLKEYMDEYRTGHRG